jgi:Protein of unknown function (DUF4233)
MPAAADHPGDPAEPPGAEAEPAGAVPAGAVPAGAVPAGAVPAGAVPAGAEPRSAESGGGAAGAGLPGAPDPAEVRARRARAVRGVFAGTLMLEALVVLFVPRAIAQFGDGLTGARLGLPLGLAGLLLLVAFSQRRRWGIAAGSVLQVGLIACGVLTAAMYALGVVFGLIWLYLLRMRRDLLG